MVNKNVEFLKVKDFSLQLDKLPSDKLFKMLDIANDRLYTLQQEVKDTKEYIDSIKHILNNRGE